MKLISLLLIGDKKNDLGDIFSIYSLISLYEEAMPFSIVFSAAEVIWSLKILEISTEFVTVELLWFTVFAALVEIYVNVINKFSSFPSIFDIIQVRLKKIEK